jgi:hypothetical protein
MISNAKKFWILGVLGVSGALLADDGVTYLTNDDGAILTS